MSGGEVTADLVAAIINCMEAHDTEKLTFLIFVIMEALAALIFAARLNVATPKAGLGLELDVIAACFIGGAVTTGGVGKVIGAVIGAFIMGVMNNGMSIMSIGISR